jgi:type II secretory pathway pseudopilin PulG
MAATTAISSRVQRRAPGAAARGFAYVALLLVLAGVALSALQVTESTRLARQREAERQLLFAGRQYRDAIDRYTRRDAGALKGIAITSIDASNGSWQYTINGGGSWSSLSGVSSASKI